MAKIVDAIINNSFDNLTPKYRRVLGERFGLFSGKRATLQEIGNKLGITRERVRQIENNAIVKIKPILEKEAKNILTFGQDHLAKAGGIREDEIFINDVLNYFNEKTKHSDKKLRFIFLVVGLPFYYFEDENLRSFWYLKESDKKRLIDFHDGLVSFFNNHDKEDIFEKKVHLHYFKDLSTFHFASIFKKFSLNYFGDFGFKEWREIQPKTIRDKIYLVLKKSNQPLHFREITKKIEQLKFDLKKVNFQTVHNELIKDERFVLVGRGIYALREQGYEPGTVREVIISLLKKHGPLSREEIVAMVKQKRILRHQTILLNLQNRYYFKRLEDGRYTLRNN